MDETSFADRFETLHHETFLRIARRIPDKRARLSPETTGLMHHLAGAGPLSIGEQARHTGRAQSTASAMVAPLIDRGLLERDRDPQDARRYLIWLSREGQAALHQALLVLDPVLLAQAAARLTAQERAQFIALFEKLRCDPGQKTDPTRRGK